MDRSGIDEDRQVVLFGDCALDRFACATVLDRLLLRAGGCGFRGCDSCDCESMWMSFVKLSIADKQPLKRDPETSAACGNTGMCWYREQRRSCNASVHLEQSGVLWRAAACLLTTATPNHPSAQRYMMYLASTETGFVFTAMKESFCHSRNGPEVGTDTLQNRRRTGEPCFSVRRPRRACRHSD